MAAPAKPKKTRNTKQPAKKVVDTVAETKSSNNIKNKIPPVNLKNVNLKKVGLIVIVGLLLGLVYMNRNEVIVATVNGRPVTRLDLWLELEDQNAQAALDNLIDKKLIRMEADIQNVSVSDAEVEEEIKTIEEGIVAQGYTLEQVLGFQGLTRETLKEQVRLQLMLERLLPQDVEVTEAEVDAALANIVTEELEETPELREQVREELRQSKISQSAQIYITSLRERSIINQEKEF